MTSASEYASSPISDTPVTLARIDATLDAHSTRIDSLHTRLKELEDTTHEPTTPGPAVIATLTESGAITVETLVPGLSDNRAAKLLMEALRIYRTTTTLANELARSDAPSQSDRSDSR